VFKGRHFQDELIVVCVRRYLRYSLSYRDLEELMAERGLRVDHSTLARWVLRYAPILSQRMRRHLRNTNRSWRLDETYVRVAGNWTYLYRALDSEGNTVDFLLSPHRDRVAAKHFLQLALGRVRHLRPRVINVDGHPAYPSVIAELKQTDQLPKSCRCRRSRYLNNLIEQDHRFLKKRIVASQGFRSVEGALHTIQGYEAVHMIRKGQIRWLRNGDTVGQLRFVNRLFGIAA
jgi:transposase-like protein